jgi:hypothetical protein
MKRTTFFLALVLLSTPLFASDLRTGLWSAQLDGDALHINLVRPSKQNDGYGQNNIGTTIRLASLTGLAAADIQASAANVQFALQAPAGTIAFDGRFSNGLGAGNYRFTPSDGFLREMESMGYSGFKDEELLMFTMESFRPQTIRDLRALGYTIDKSKIDEIAIFKIDANAVREYAALGYPNLALHDLVQFRVARIDAAFVKGTREVFGNVSAHDLTQLGILKVTPDYVRELRGAGLESLTPNQATQLKIANITAAKIAEYRRLGYDLTPSQLQQFGIFKITPQFIAEARARDGKDLSPRQLIDMKIFSAERHR